MSRDTQSDAQTFLVETSPGWKSRQDASHGSIEFFVLRGDLTANGSRVGASGYVHLPQGGGGGELSSEAGALCVVFWNPNMPAFHRESNASGSGPRMAAERS